MSEAVKTYGVVDVMLATAWKPQPGETLTGALVHKELRTGGDYGDYVVAYFDDGSGTLTAVHCFHQTLRDGLKELNPTRGEFVSVTYAGEKDSNKRRDKDGAPVVYHHYAVYDPASTIEEAASNWDDIPF